LVSISDIDLKVASKFFGTRFACGSSVTGDDEIVIQGDVKDDLFDVIPEKWPTVSILPSTIFMLVALRTVDLSNKILFWALFPISFCTTTFEGQAT